MTLGKLGVKGDPPDALTEPTDVATDPDNGDIYLAESHTRVEDRNLVGRISVFDRNGKFLRIIGKTGTGPGEFRTPHMIKFDYPCSGSSSSSSARRNRCMLLLEEFCNTHSFRSSTLSAAVAVGHNRSR